MELTFRQKVGSSEVETLLSEVTKDGKMDDLEVSSVVIDGFIKGQLLFASNIFKPRKRNGISTVLKFKLYVDVFKVYMTDLVFICSIKSSQCTDKYTMLSISTDGRRKASATSLREVGYFFP